MYIKTIKRKLAKFWLLRNFRKIYSRALMIVTSLVLSASLILPNTAYATSDYDSTLQATPNLFVYTDGSAKTQTMDISTTWWRDYKQTYAKRVAQNIGWPTNFVTEFEDIMTSGGSWGVLTAESADGIMIEIVGSRDPNAYCEFAGTAISGSFDCKSHPGYGFVSTGYFTHNSYGGNGCIGSSANRCSDNGMNIYTAPYVQTGTVGYTVESIPVSLSSVKIFFMNFDINYPPGYAGVMIPQMRNDTDGDELTAAEENAQGTSDINDDTDGDGIDDLKESIFFEDRDDVFCGTLCAYPNPLKKDIYVENDWMDDGTTEYKPSSTQIGLIEDAFDAKNIDLHIDSGQYGGGAELPVYISPFTFVPDTEEVDYFNFKNGDSTYDPTFAENRKGIWRYLITGNKHYSSTSSTDRSGSSYAGDDDMIVSIGRIKEIVTNPALQDDAIAGTIMHELGHSLCLSDSAYSGQDSSCLYNYIDNKYAPMSYASVMNYNKQFEMVDYSGGSNIIDDHDDWSGILVGMNDFVAAGDPSEEVARGPVLFNRPLQD